LLHYFRDTQKNTLTNVVKISLHSQEKRVLMDEVTIKNLEIFSSSYEGSEKYSLAHLLDTTKTSGGSRLLRYLLANPINALEELNRRINNIEYYT